jgi:hypothetical protein
MLPYKQDGRGSGASLANPGYGPSHSIFVRSAKRRPGVLITFYLAGSSSGSPTVCSSIPSSSGIWRTICAAPRNGSKRRFRRLRARHVAAPQNRRVDAARDPQSRIAHRSAVACCWQ